MKKLFFLLVLVSVVFGIENWNGWGDTSLVYGLHGTGSVVRSKVFQHGKYEHISMYVFFNDTTSAGYSGDSCAFRYGFELGVPCLNTSGAVDTLWTPVTWADSVDYDSEGDMTAAHADQSLTITKARGWVDTSNVTGWAYTGTQVTPEGGPPLIRAAFEGIADNCATALKLMVQLVQRLGSSNTTR